MCVSFFTMVHSHQRPFFLYVQISNSPKGDSMMETSMSYMYNLNALLETFYACMYESLIYQIDLFGQLVNF